MSCHLWQSANQSWIQKICWVAQSKCCKPWSTGCWPQLEHKWKGASLGCPSAQTGRWCWLLDCFYFHPMTVYISPRNTLTLLRQRPEPQRTVSQLWTLTLRLEKKGFVLFAKSLALWYFPFRVMQRHINYNSSMSWLVGLSPREQELGLDNSLISQIPPQASCRAFHL